MKTAVSGLLLFGFSVLFLRICLGRSGFGEA